MPENTNITKLAGNTREITQTDTPLTKKQQQFLAFLSTNPTLLTTTEEHMLSVAGISKYFYKWLKQPHFLAAYRQVGRDALARSVPRLTARSIDRAMRDSFQDTKLMLEMAGEVQPSGSQQNVQVNIAIPEWAKE